MSFRSLLRSKTRHESRAGGLGRIGRTRGGLSRRLGFEMLEDRRLLSAIPTATAVIASTSSCLYGESVTFTAAVTTSPASATTPNGGTVRFIEGNVTLATVPLAAGVATWTTTSLSAGRHVVTATYSGNGANFDGSTTDVGSDSIICTFAGGGVGDGTLATAAPIGEPFGLTLDAAGNIYIADSSNNRIRKVDHVTGVITTVAGNGMPGYSGDGGPATDASLWFPNGVVVNAVGDIFIADTSNNRIRRVDHATGLITTVAGGGTSDLGDNGLGTAARLHGPMGLAVDAAGNIFIADTGDDRVRKVDHSTGKITTVAGIGFGNGIGDPIGDGGLATSAKLSAPEGVTLDAAGNLFIADSSNYRVRKVDRVTGIITTVAGIWPGSFSDSNYNGDNRLATTATIIPRGIALDAAGNLFIADGSNLRVRRVDHVTGIITTVAGSGWWSDLGDNGPATAAQVNDPCGVVLDSAGNLFIAATGQGRIRRVDHATQIITSVAGYGATHLWDNGPATAATLSYPDAVASNALGDIYIADTANSRIRKVDHATGVITTIAGGGNAGLGDNGPATAASLYGPSGLAIDAAGNIFIVDRFNDRIRMVNGATGIITTVAGSGTSGLGDGGQATAATLTDPVAVALDGVGNLYISDLGDNRVRKVTRATGVIITIAGNGTWGYSQDNILATTAALRSPFGVAVDTDGNIFFADCGSCRVRKVDHATGLITTVAGSGSAGSSGDGGPATAASIGDPFGIALDAAGNLFIADEYCSRIRKVDHVAGVITSVAGGGYGGDMCEAADSSLLGVFGIALDPAGNLYIADVNRYRIREVCSGALVTVKSPNIRPTVSVVTPSMPKSGNVAINYTLTDAESDLCGVEVQYSPDNGSTWLAATRGPGGDATLGIVSSASGTAHTFVWASGSDIANANNSNVQIRIVPFDSGGAGLAGKTTAFTVSNRGPAISGVVVAEAGTTKNGKLEVGEKLRITWAASSASGIASQTMTVDGNSIAPISGPFSGLYFSCTIGSFSAGSHTYTIKATDAKGVSATSAGTFTVVSPPPPAISSVLVVEAAAPKNGKREAGEKLKITWAASSASGIASQTMTVDGKAIAPIYGPFSGLYYSCSIGSYSVGSHTYKIRSTDSKGISATSTATFAVLSPPPPTISSIVVAEGGATKNGKLEANEKLRITWAASSASGIASQSMTVDGRAITPISGPFSGLYYSCTVGTFATGSHSYTIKTTDKKGVSASKSGTFTVVAAALAASFAHRDTAAEQRASLLNAVMQEMERRHGYTDASHDALTGDFLPFGVR
jgi:hypothetical protein